MSSLSIDLNEVTVKEVVDTDSNTSIVVPFQKGQEALIRQEVSDLQNRFSEIIAKKYDLDVEKIRDCIPNNILFKEISNSIDSSKKNKEPSPPKKYNLSNWKEVTDINDLKSLKVSELKDIILSEGNGKTSGNKATLIDKVWKILYPDKEIVKKEKKSTLRKNRVIVDDTDDDELTTEIVENMLNNSKTTIMNDGTSKQVIVEKGWVFTIIGEDEYEWVGTIDQTGNSYRECDPPEEIVMLYQ